MAHRTGGPRMSVDAILKEIAALTDAERAELLDRLAEQFPDAAGEEISPELAKLLDERVAAADANPDAGYTLEEVIAHVKRQK
jgi:putative addiction module component (TIGR02574 family)